MARGRDGKTGRFQGEGKMSIFGEAFQHKGRFDPEIHRLIDDFNRTGGQPQRIRQKRTVAPLMLYPSTLDLLERLARMMGTNRGRVVDALVEKAEPRLVEWEKRSGITPNVESDELSSPSFPPEPKDPGEL